MIRSLLKQVIDNWRARPARKRLWRRMEGLRTAGAVLGDSVYENSFHVRFRRLGPDRLSIGDGGMIGCGIVFEKEDTGRVMIGSRCHIGEGSMLISVDGIEIEDDVTIAWNCTIYDHDSHALDWEKRQYDTRREVDGFRACGDSIRYKDWSAVGSAPIRIRSKAWIGFGVTILKGVTIGEGAIIGAMSVVTKDIPAFSVAAGNPARVVRNNAGGV